MRYYAANIQIPQALQMKVVQYTTVNTSSYLIRWKKFFAQPKVCQYNVSIRIQQYVLQLNVAINNAQLKQRNTATSRPR